MSGHTPGPWHEFIQLDTEVFAVFGPDNDPKNPVVEWSGFDDNLSKAGARKTAANVRLIAAAPDLLEALSRIVESDDHHGQLTVGERMQACAAIHKAKGERHE